MSQNFKSIRREELIQSLKNDSYITFYHLVKIDLSGGYGKSEFVRGESLYEDKSCIYNTWAQGLYHFPQKSFISEVYNEFKTKYSIHLFTNLIGKRQEAYIKDIKVENRDIFIEVRLPWLEHEYKLILSKPPKISDDLDSFITDITQDVNFIAAGSPVELDAEIIRNVNCAVGKIFMKDIRIGDHLKKIIFRLVRFLYPTSWEPRRQYSVFIIPGYVSGDVELTSGGAVALFKPIGFSRLFRKKIERIHNKTALWSNLETVDSLLALSKNQSRHAAISQVMARNMSHNLGSHVFSKMITKEAVDSDYYLDGNQYKSIPGLNEIDNEIRKV